MRIGWLLVSFAWFLLLGVWSSWPAEEGHLWTLFANARFSGWSWDLLADVLAVVALELLPYVLLGVFCLLACRGRAGLFGRLLALPLALALSLGFAFLLAGLDARTHWRAPAAVEWVLPALGCLIGIVLGGAFARPPLLVVPSLLGRVIGLAAAALIGVLVLAAALLSDTAPAAPNAAITSDEKLALIDELRRQNPLRLAAGGRTVLALAPAQLQSLLSWGVLLIDPEARAEVRALPGGLGWLASVRIPGVPLARRHLTLQGELAVASREGLLQVDRCGFSAGTLDVGPWLCGSLVESLHRAVLSSTDFAALSAAVEWLSIDGKGLTASYTRPELDADSLHRLQLALGPGRAIRAAAQAQFELLRVQAPDLARHEDRFGAILQAAFELAARRSAADGAVAENQGAILALATILGHQEVATLAGIERPADWAEIRATLWPVELRERADWSRHFLVSAGLTQISTAVMSDAAGLLKEELDAARGSGFSFGDLLADRAGTRFGELAGRDEATARALQTALVGNYRVADLMPSGDGLPEGLSDADFERRYGGVGGPGYQTLLTEIEARIARLPDFGTARP